MCKEMLNVSFPWVAWPKSFPDSLGEVFIDTVSSSNSINQLIVIYDNHNCCMILVSLCQERDLRCYEGKRENSQPEAHCLIPLSIRCSMKNSYGVDIHLLDFLSFLSHLISRN